MKIKGTSIVANKKYSWLQSMFNLTEAQAYDLKKGKEIDVSNADVLIEAGLATKATGGYIKTTPLPITKKEKTETKPIAPVKSEMEE